MAPKVSKRSTPARAATPRRATTPRRETRQTTPKTPRNPAPSLSVSPIRPPLPPLPPIIAISSSLSAAAPKETSNRWVEQQAPFDPVFATFDATRSAENIVGHTIQSLDHCASLYYPDIAEGYGMKRWGPAKLPRMGSRGSTCYVEGTTQTSCHKKAIPAFMYTHQSIKEGSCPFAEREGFPSLVCRYKIDKSGQLHFGACWACSTRGNSPCPIIQLPPLKAPNLALSNEALARQMQMSARKTKVRGRSASVASLDDRASVKRAVRQQAIQEAVLPGAYVDTRRGVDDRLAFSDRSSASLQHVRHDLGLNMPSAVADDASNAPGIHSGEFNPLPDPSGIEALSPVYMNPSPPPEHQDLAVPAAAPLAKAVEASSSDGNKVRLWAAYMQNRARSRTPSQPTSHINVADHLPPVPRTRSMGQNDSAVQAAIGLPAVVPSTVLHEQHVVNPESAQPATDAPDQSQATEVSFDKDAHRATLSALLSLPLAAAKRYSSEMEHFEIKSHEAFEALFAKVDEIERAARNDRAAIDAVRAERDKVTRTNRGLDTKIAVISKEAKDHEVEITRLNGMIKYYEGKLEESQSERRTSDERMTEATIERDEAIEASNNADKARAEAEAERDHAQQQRDEAQRQQAETDAAMDDMMADMTELEGRVEAQGQTIIDLQAEKHRLEEEVAALRTSQPVHLLPEMPNPSVQTDTTGHLSQAAGPDAGQNLTASVSDLDQQGDAQDDDELREEDQEELV